MNCPVMNCLCTLKSLKQTRFKIIFFPLGLSSPVFDVQPARATNEARRDSTRQQRSPSAVCQFEFPSKQIGPWVEPPSGHLDRVWRAAFWTGVHRGITVWSQQQQTKCSVLTARIPSGKTWVAIRQNYVRATILDENCYKTVSVKWVSGASFTKLT